MYRTTAIALVLTGMAAIVVSAACGSDSNGDNTNTGTNTGTATSTNTGSCSCLSCSGYTVECLQNGCPQGDPLDVFCADSLAIVDALNQCVCDPNKGNCQAQCGYTCSLEINQGGGSAGGSSGSGGAGGALVDSATCIQCQNDAVMTGAKPCLNEWSACSLDNVDNKCN